MALERLDKLLSNAGYGSRREIAAIARSGGILVNGEVCRAPERKLDSDSDCIIVSGQRAQVQRQYYFMLNKPAGVITATRDNFQRTVIDLLPAQLQRIGLFAVGRLDKDTEGLLLLTTDGAFNHALMSPRGHTPKVYEARFEGTLRADAKSLFAQGIALDDGTHCKPALLEQANDGQIRITLYEGKFHQVKRMVSAIGGRVTALRRISIGTLQLDASLESGEFRALSVREYQDLLPKTDI